MTAGSRIEQFQKMANDDPSNPVGHLSLGREYLTAGMYPEAERSLSRTIEIDPKISKAYELLGQALLNLEQRDRAIDVLTRGAKQADERGDLMPRNAMVKMLSDLGAPAPEFTAARGPATPVGEGMVHCQKCGQVKPRQSRVPLKSELGKEIYEKICADCFREWIGMGTKVINELRLPLSDPQAQKIYEQHMVEFLGLR
jgi:Fe-S cluster biosynthesis and repair protein YggX